MRIDWIVVVYITHTHTHTYIYIYIYIYIYSGGKIFDPLLILYVCSLTNKWSVYNFNGRFIWTVRDKITTKKSICILMSQISIWPLRKTWLITWWQNPCWQSQRSDVSCSWPPGLHTSREGFWIPSSLHILSKSLRFQCWRLATRTFNSLHSFSMGLRFGDWLGHSRTLMCFFLSQSVVALAVCFGSLPICFQYLCWLQCPGSDGTWPLPSSLWCGAVVLSP